MVSFGLVCEGIIDQIIIEHILYSFFNDPDIPVNMLQPLRDETDENRAANFGNWHKVIEYIRSSDFRQSFGQNEYVVVQVDSDVFAGENVPKEYAIPPNLTVEEKSERLVNLLISEMGKEFYQAMESRIIFAIAVDEIECWLLPFYYTDNKKAKTENCLGTLNRALSKDGYTIDPNHKLPGIYRKVIKPLKKKRNVDRKGILNPSLNSFLTDLKEREIKMPDTEEDW